MTDTFRIMRSTLRVEDERRYVMVIHCTVCDEDLASASAAEEQYQAMLGSLVMIARHHREQVGENHWINWRYLGEDR